MAVPALKRTPHTTIKQGQELLSRLSLPVSLKIISNQSATAKLCYLWQGELNKAFNQSPCTQTFNQPLGLLLYLLVSTGPAKSEASKSSRKLGTSPHGIGIPLERDRCDIKKHFRNHYVVHLELTQCHRSIIL